MTSRAMTRDTMASGALVRPAMPGRVILAYGLLGLPLAFAALPVYVHLPRLYADRGRLDLAAIGAILFAARLLDAVIDPWLGWLADRVRRRAMVAAALPAFAIGFVALLNPPSTEVAVWLIGSLTLTYAGFSAVSVAYQAWAADVGTDPATLTRLTASREGFGLLGVVLAAVAPSLLAADLGEGVSRLSFALPPLLALCAAVALGTVGAGLPAAAAGPFAASLRQALGDPAFRRLLAIFAFNGIAAALPATLFLFFVEDVLQSPALGGPLLALYFIAGAVSLPAWVRLADRLGRPRAWLAGMGLAMAAFAGAGLLGSGDGAAFAAICLASGLALGADLALPAAIAADLGQRQGQAGACFGVWNFVSKLNLALAAGLALPLLAALGYAPGSGTGAPALSFAYALLPLGFKALAGVLLWRWRSSLEIAS